jgi:LuxR family maltose regulon positive regulatory protein
MLYCRVLATVELADAMLDDGNLDAGRLAFEEARALVETESFGVNGRGWLARAGTRLALAAGDIDEARGWAQQLDDPFWGPIGAARVHLAGGRRSDALAAVDRAVPRCARHEVVADLVRSRAVATQEESVGHLTAALRLAVTHGMLQSVASEGDDIVRLSESAAWTVPRTWLDNLRRAAVPARPAGRDPSGDPTASLTDRERDVLRFLPSRLTLREIAAELHISLNTVKFHQKVIYRKLGVNTRSQAADVARRLAAVRG